MITVEHVSKRYGSVVAVDDLSFDVEAGQVTGFLGPNGSGKSTTMRMIVGLDNPTAGRVTVAGRAYTTIRFPLSEVGALLDAGAAHPSRSGYHHLLWLAASNRIPAARVEVVLGMVGLADVARRRVSTYSLGMRQRLGIAAALLGDPAVLVFDEPINGLDLEGIIWVRTLLRDLAQEGRTVLVSSHLMSEMAMTADHLVIIGAGRLLATGRVADFIERTAGHRVHVESPDAARLVPVLRAAGATVVTDGPEGITVSGLEPRDVGTIAAGNHATLYELAPQHASLEDAYLELTREPAHR